MANNQQGDQQPQYLLKIVSQDKKIIEDIIMLLEWYAMSYRNQNENIEKEMTDNESQDVEVSEYQPDNTNGKSWIDEMFDIIEVESTKHPKERITIRW